LPAAIPKDVQLAYFTALRRSEGGEREAGLG